MKVLLTDDDKGLVTVFATALTDAGYETAIANNGAEALAKAKSEKPDVILLDQILPDTSGNELLKTLKADEETKNIPIAIVSNYNDMNLMQEAIGAGAADYIYKYNIEPKDLVAKVEEIANNNKHAVEQDQPTEEQPAQEGEQH